MLQLSLTGAYAASVLLDLIRKSPKRNLFHHSSGDMRYELRACTVRGKRSGGCVVSVNHRNGFEHQSGTGRWLTSTRRLKDMDDDRVKRAMSQCEREVRERLRIYQLRERAYRLLNPIPLSDADINRIEGLVSSPLYSEMTEDDCRVIIREAERLRTRL